MQNTRKPLCRYLVITSFVILIVIFIAFAFPTGHSSFSKKAKDAIIVDRIDQVKILMISICANEDIHNSFTCESSKEMAKLCQEIDNNYRQDNNEEPVIANNNLSNINAFCIFSPLNGKPLTIRSKSFWYEFWHYNQKYWYCTDSGGRTGYTIVDPGSNGYCVNGKSTTCPPFFE